MTETAKKARQLQESKLQTIMKYIAGAAVTLTTAVASVINPMAAAEAKFLSYEAAGTDLVYEAYVDASYDESGEAEIQIVARDQFGDHTQTVWTGRSSGVFTDLDPGTDYELLIQINNGFGWRVLAKETVTTDVGPGGAIVGYDLAESAPLMESGMWQYTVALHVSDPESAFTSVTFRYASLYDYELAYLGSQTIEEYLAARFTSVDLTAQTDASVALPEMWKQAAWLYWYLEAETAEGTVVLDSRVVVTPPVFYGYVSVYDAGLNFIEVYARAHPVAGVQASFELILTTADGEIVDRVDIEPVAEGEPQEGESTEPDPIRFEKLLKDTEYRLELRVTYIDPETGYEFTTVVASAVATTTVVEPGGAIVGYDVVENTTYPESIYWDYTVDVHVTDPFYAYSTVSFKYASISDYEREYLGTQTVEEYLASRWSYVWLTGQTDATVTLPEMWREASTWYWVLEAVTAQGTVILDSRIVETPPIFGGYVYGAGAGSDYLDVYAYAFADAEVPATFALLLKTPEGALLDTIAVEPTTEGSQPAPIRLDGLSPSTAYLLELVATYEGPDGVGTSVSLVGSAVANTTEVLPLSSGAITDYDVVENTSYAEMIYWDYTVYVHVSDPAETYQSVSFRYASLYEFERANLGSQTVEEYLAGRWTSIDLTGYPDASVSLPEMERSPFTWYWILEAETFAGTVVLDSHEIATPPFFGGSIFTAGAGSDYLDIVGLALLNPDVPAAFQLQLLTLNGEPLSQVVVQPILEGGQPTQVRFGGLQPMTGYRLELVAVYDDPDSGEPTVSIVARAVAFTIEVLPLSSGAITDYDVVENTSYAEMIFLDYTVDLHVSDPAATYQSVSFLYASLYEFERANLGSQTVEEYLAGRWTSIDLTGHPDASVSLPEMGREPFTWYWILEAETEQGTIVLDSREIATPPFFGGSIFAAGAGSDYLDIVGFALLNPEVPAAFRLQLLTMNGEPLSQVVVEPVQQGGQPTQVRFGGLVPMTGYRLELVAVYDDPDSGEPTVSIIARAVAQTTDVLPLSSGAITDYDVVENTSYAEMIFWDYTVYVHVSDPAATYQSVLLHYATLYEFERATLGTQTVEEFLADRWNSIDLTGYPDVSISLPEMGREPFTWYWILEAETAQGTVVLDSRSVDTPPLFTGSVALLETGVDFLSVYAFASANPDVAAAFVLRLMTADGDFVSEISVDPAVEGQSLPIRFDGLLPETAYRLELSAAYTDPGSVASASLVARFRTLTAAIPEPLAEAVFLTVGAVGGDLAYEAYINAFTGISATAPIRIVARNLSGDVVRTVWAGRCAGVFTDLEPDTEYTLTIEIDEGYGWQTLAGTTVSTASGAGGAIVGCDYAATNMNMEAGYWTYAVDLHVTDPDAIYTSVTFRYAFFYDYETWYLGQQTVEEYLAHRFVTVDLDGTNELWVALPDMWMEAFTWYWYLEAATAEGTVVLDHRVVDTPPVFRGFVYAIDAGPDSLTAYASAFVNPLMPADYVLRLSTPEGAVVADIALTPTFGGGPFIGQETGEPVPLRFEGLSASTAYRLELLATYVDPETGFALTTVFAAAEAPTMPAYTQSFTWIESKTHIDFEASFTDPAGAIGNIYYEVFVFSEGFWRYQNGNTVTLTVVGDVKTASFTVHRPANAFRICVYVDKMPSPTIYYASLLADIFREAE